MYSARYLYLCIFTEDAVRLKYRYLLIFLIIMLIYYVMAYDRFYIYKILLWPMIDAIYICIYVYIHSGYL